MNYNSVFMYTIISFSALQLHWCIYYIILYSGKITLTSYNFTEFFYSIQKFISLIRSALSIQIWDSYSHSLFMFMVQ